MLFDNLFLSLILTAVVYMAFPLIRLLINGKRFSKKRAHKIALWNSIVVGAVFCIATAALSEGVTTWNAAPAFLYYWINKAVLTDKNIDESNEAPNKKPIKFFEKVKTINIFKTAKTIKVFEAIKAVKIIKILKFFVYVCLLLLNVVVSFILGVLTSETILMLIFGNSVEGLVALLMVFIFGIVCTIPYFLLFFYSLKAIKKAIIFLLKKLKVLK